VNYLLRRSLHKELCDIAISYLITNMSELLNNTKKLIFLIPTSDFTVRMKKQGSSLHFEIEQKKQAFIFLKTIVC
jgi:hypothetical protein